MAGGRAGKASIEAKGALVLLNAVSQGDLEKLLLLIRDVKTGKAPVESRPCLVCREKGHKVKHKREELQSSVRFILLSPSACPERK